MVDIEAIRERYAHDPQVMEACDELELLREDMKMTFIDPPVASVTTLPVRGRVKRHLRVVSSLPPQC